MSLIKKTAFLISALVISNLGFSQYCTNGGPSQPDDSDLGAITLNGESNNINIPASCPGTLGIEDLTATQNADLVANNSYSISVDFNTCGAGNINNAGQVWIDFDNSETFDEDESIGTWSGLTPSGAQTFNFTVPEWVCNLTTRIRIKQQEDGTLPLDPCNSFSWGAVTDAEVTFTGGTCQIEGCTDPDAPNYNPNATVDDGSCNAGNGNPQDCIGAIPLCIDAVYTSPNGQSYQGIGDVTNEFLTDNTCFGTGVGMPAGEPEVNSVWYTFTVPNDGDLNFTITPDSPVDYDWAVFDITGPDHSCETLHEDGAVSCNWSGATGADGSTGPNGQDGSQFEDPFPVIAGNSYAIVVTDFAASGVAMTIDFTESTANIFATDMNTVDQEVCYGDSADLKALYTGPSFGDVTYTWSPGIMTVDSTKKNTTTTAIYEDTTIFIVSLDLGECQLSDSLIVYGYEIYADYEFFTDSLLDPMEVEFYNASDPLFDQYWDFANGDTSNEYSPDNQFYTEPGDYEVMLAVENILGCKDTIIKTITMPEFHVPNIITPNGDGVNDSLIIVGLTEITTLEVYNRWGKLVAQVPGYKNNWDGGDLQDGTYFFQVIRQNGAILERAKGWVEIRR